MTKRKIKIIHNFKEGASGGGNRFLNQLRDELKFLGQYSDINPDIAIWNSFPFGKPVKTILNLYLLFLKKKYLIHRTDGPTMIVRGNPSNIIYDYITMETNRLFASATIFQSDFSKELSFAIGWKKRSFDSLIKNSAASFFDIDINYYKNKDKEKNIVISAWSSNIKKGFDIYEELPNIIPHGWKLINLTNRKILSSRDNVENKMIVNPEKLSKILQKSYVYITASIDDPCSNALLEAKSSGCIIIARSEGGHPELISNEDYLFSNKEDLKSIFIDIVNRFPSRKKNQNVFEENANLRYINLINQINLRETNFNYFLFFKLLIYSFFVSYLFYGYRYISIVRSFLRFKETGLLPKYIEKLGKYPNKLRDKLKGNNSYAEYVLNKVKIFPDKLRDKKGFKTCICGFLNSNLLANTVYASRIYIMTETVTEEIKSHIINSFNDHKYIDGYYDKRIIKSNKIKSFIRFRKNHVKDLKRAETRQALAVIKSLNLWTDYETYISNNYAKEFIDNREILYKFQWDNPWSALSHVSHYLFFISSCSFEIETKKENIYEILNLIEKFKLNIFSDFDYVLYKQSDIINGAMKLITGIESVEEYLDNEFVLFKEKEVELILKSIEDYEPISMCEMLNSVKSFGYLYKNYKNLKKGNFILDLITRRLMKFFWDYQCGFSMYESYAGSKVYGFRTSTGLRESDMQATCLGVWCCKLIDQISNGKDFKIIT